MLPNPILEFAIGSNVEIKVHMYGVMIALGLLCTFIVLFTYGKKIGLKESFIDFIYYNAIASIALGFVSAAAFQGLYNYIEDPSKGFNLNGGITFIGGLIGGVATFLLIYFIVRKKLSGRVFDMVSLAPPCILIAHAFGRVGCFFAGCCYGLPTDSFLGVQFPGMTHKVHPTMLYEAAFLFILFGVCSYLLLKKNFRHNMSLYLVTYGIFRFAIEFVRDDSRGELVAGISPSQFWSILMVGIGVGIYFYMEYLIKKNTPAAEEIPEEEATAEEQVEEVEEVEANEE